MSRDTRSFCLQSLLAPTLPYGLHSRNRNSRNRTTCRAVAPLDRPSRPRLPFTGILHSRLILLAQLSLFSVVPCCLHASSSRATGGALPSLRLVLRPHSKNKGHGEFSSSLVSVRGTKPMPRRPIAQSSSAIGDTQAGERALSCDSSSRHLRRTAAMLHVLVHAGSRQSLDSESGDSTAQVEQRVR